MSSLKRKELTAEEFDAAFDEAFETGEDMTPYLDLKSIKVCHPMQRISIDFPKNVLKGIDAEAAKIGVTRTSLIKMWVAQLVFKHASVVA